MLFKEPRILVGKSEQLLDAAFHREVLKCFTVTR